MNFFKNFSDIVRNFLGKRRHCFASDYEIWCTKAPSIIVQSPLINIALNPCPYLRYFAKIRQNAPDFTGRQPRPFPWRFSAKTYQNMHTMKTHPDLRGLFPPFWWRFRAIRAKIAGSIFRANPGVLRGFPDRGSGNRSPIQARIPGAGW